MALNSAETLELKEASPRRLGRGQRIAVVVLGIILAGAACVIIGLAFVQGSWWYSYMTDQALDYESRARVEAIRDEVDASGTAPEAVMWLNAALESNADPTTVRSHLLAAQEVLEAAGDPKLAEAVRELQEIIQTIRPRHFGMTTTPRPAPTLEWPW